MHTLTRTHTHTSSTYAQNIYIYPATFFLDSVKVCRGPVDVSMGVMRVEVCVPSLSRALVCFVAFMQAVFHQTVTACFAGLVRKVFLEDCAKRPDAHRHAAFCVQAWAILI